MLNKLKNDFNSVRGALCYLTNRKVPFLVALIWYIMWAPLGLLLYIPGKIYMIIILKKFERMDPFGFGEEEA